MCKKWNILKFDTLTSTNDEAKKFCKKTCEKIVICAKKQTAGRGRRGRQWISQTGNLFFSQIIQFDIRLLGSLIIAVSLSVLETIRTLSENADVKIKWPNDILLNKAKVCGILLETADNNNIIIGVGVNITNHPDNDKVIYPTTSLKANNIITSPQKFLSVYLQKFDKNILHIKNSDTEIIIKKWLQYAYNLHKKITLQQDKNLSVGIFTGIDKDACLLLETNGEIKKIYAGDILYNGEKND